MEQEVKYINIKDLVLWTENPRDPIDENAVDQDIVDKALNDTLSKWNLPKLAKEMGGYYDYSELPTVVYHNNKPVVYDGNRRIILGKIKYGLVSNDNILKLNIPDFPSEIPCNVCVKEIALKNVYRKHSDSGSWHPLERDIFLHKFMGEKKSAFLILEENTRLITANPHLNQRFVKDEIFKEDTMSDLGFKIKDDKLQSIHDDAQSYLILSDISRIIENKIITTRENRGKVLDVLNKSSKDLISKNKKNRLHKANLRFDNGITPLNDLESKNDTKRLSRRVSTKEIELFGGKLYLQAGDVSNLYRDITDLYLFFKSNKGKLSNSFPSLIRMSLRLLCESAAKDKSNSMEQYLKGNFALAKQKLDADMKTTLSNQNVTENSIIQLLHTGAHNYQTANNLDQTIAMSIIIGEIITITYGKED